MPLKARARAREVPEKTHLFQIFKLIVVLVFQHRVIISIHYEKRAWYHVESDVR